MALEELKQDLIEADADMRSYLETSEEYLQLKVFKILMHSVTNLAQIALVGTLIVVAVVMLSLGASLAINEKMDSFYIGFVIVGLGYVLIAVLCYFFREQLDKPLLRKFSKHYFD